MLLNRKKIHLIILAVIAVLIVVLFAHGQLTLSDTSGKFMDQGIPKMSSVELLYFTAASQLASGKGFYLDENLSQFPEAVKGKMGNVPAVSPVFLSIVSLPAKWADTITPDAESIEVSSDLTADEALKARNYLEFFHRYKWTVIFFQTPFLILLLLHFYLASARFIPDPGNRFWSTLALCFGTLCYPFALTLNPILPASALLLCGLHYALSFGEKGNTADGITGGLFIGTALAINYLIYIPAVALIVWLVLKLKEPEKLLPYIGGLAPGIAGFVLAHIMVFGDPMPAIFHRGGGDANVVILWKHLVWSLAGYNGALWMSPLVAVALIHSLWKHIGEQILPTLRTTLGITAVVLLLAVSLETVLTFQPVPGPKEGVTLNDAFTADRGASPQLDMEITGFPLAVGFQTKTYGGEALALIGPCLFLMFCGIFASKGTWGAVGQIALRVGIILAIAAAANPLGARLFPLFENLSDIGMNLAQRFPRESIF